MPAGGQATAAQSVSYPAASFSFRWSRRAGRWLVWTDGTTFTTGSGRRMTFARGRVWVVLAYS